MSPAPRTLLAACALAFFAGGVAAQPDALAAHLISLGGHTKGVACVPRCGDGALAAAIARNSGMLVLALDEQEPNVTAARQVANASGLLGRTVYVLCGAASAIPLANNYVDLLVVTDATDAGLASLPQAEILRVLAPFHGRAIIGNTGSGITQAALQTWANGFGVPGTTVISDAQGVWAIITKPKLTGSDDWGQRFHGPDNNPLSADTALKYPYLTQWMGKPFHDLAYGAEVHVANGRVFSMCKLWYGSYDYPVRLNSFYARSAYNGQVLWRRDLPLRYLTGFGAVVAQGDSLFMMVGDSVAVLDAETGAIKRRIGFTGLQGQIKKIMVLDNVLVALAGARDMSTNFPTTVTDKILVDSVFYGGHPELNRYAPFPSGTELAAYDLAARSFLWRHVEATPIDLNHLALAAGKVIFYAENSRAAALDLRTGSQVWANATPAFIAAAVLDTSIHAGLNAVNGLNPQTGLLVSGDGVLIGIGASPNVVGLSASDGSLQWSVANNIYTTWLNASPIAQVVLNDTLVRRDRMFSMATGATLGTPAMDAQGCGVVTAGREKIYGQQGISGDRLTRTATGNLAGLHKTMCDVGAFIANGLHLSASFKCRCGMPTRGYKAMGSAAGYVPNQPAVEAQRLFQAAGYGTVAPLGTDASDWVTHRANAQRTGSSGVAVPLAPHLVFTFTPDVAYSVSSSDPQSTYDVDWRVTPPVAAGGYVFVGGYDGKVRCIDVATGTLAWAYECGGAVVSAPSAWNGRVYVGSCDGYAYALEAATGRLLWRFRAAPAERRVMTHGMLMSTWPVVGGVLVSGGVAYVAAGGINAENGTHVYALDAVSGSIRWQNNTLAARENLRNTGRTANGSMALARGRLWLSTSNQATFSLDTATGTLLTGSCDPEAWPAKNQGLPGGELAIFRDRFVMYGGRPFFSDHSERSGTEAFGGQLRYAIFTFLELGVQGQPRYPEVSPYADEKGVFPPVWDSDLMVLARDCITGICGWDASQADSFFTGNRATDTTYHSRDWVYASRAMNATWTPRWGPLTAIVSAAAIAQNAVVMAYRDNDNANWGDWKEKLLAAIWKVGLFDKQTGSLLWSDTLPAEPLRYGLCIDRAGNIEVALRDGRVLCYGSGVVGVLAQQAPMAVPPFVVAESAPAAAPQARPAAQAPVQVGAVGAAATRPAAVLDPRPMWQVAADPQTTAGSSLPGTASLDPPVDLSERAVARDMTWRSGQPCLAVATVLASSSRGVHGARRTIDRSLATRWCAGGGTAQWLVYDLGRATDVGAVSLVWYASTAIDATAGIEVSADGVRFERVDSGQLRGRGTRTTLRTFVPVSARYVRLTLEPCAAGAVPSVYEVGIHGAAEQASAR